MLIVFIPYVSDFKKTTIIHVECTQDTELCEVWPISLKQGCVCHSLPKNIECQDCPCHNVQPTGAACGLV